MAILAKGDVANLFSERQNRGMAITSRRYSNGEVTVLWKPELCQHSKRCWTELRAVFDPQKRPWIDVQAAGTAEIMAQVRRCPSGALSYELRHGEAGPGS